jgi:protein gp37
VGETSIEWTNFSVNPFRARLPGAGSKGGYSSGVGHYCEKVSPGCKNCYSSATQPRFGLPQFQEQRNGVVEPFFDASKLTEVLRRKAPTKWFWCDMTDMFGDWVPFEWVAACFGVMAATPQHTHQVLTKRPARALEFFRWLQDKTDRGHMDPSSRCWSEAMRATEHDPVVRAVSPRPPWPLPNVHLGVSVEDQRRADERIPLLLQCPAAVRWVSAEPLLGPVDLARIPWGQIPTDVLCGWASPDDGIKWVVLGGESGPGARPFDVAWARSIVAQCRAASVPVFVKQLGARPTDGSTPVSIPLESIGATHMAGGGAIPNLIELRNRKGGDPSEWPADLRVRMFPGDTWPTGGTP